MESTLVGLVLDSSTVIRAERSKQSIPDFIEAILKAHGRLDLSLSPVTVAELVTGSIAPRHRRLVSADGHTSKNWST